MKNDLFDEYEDDAIPLKRRPKEKASGTPARSAAPVRTARPAAGTSASRTSSAAARTSSASAAVKRTASSASRPASASSSDRTGNRPLQKKAAVSKTVRAIPAAKQKKVSDEEDRGQIAVTKREKAAAPKKKYFGKIYLVYLGVLLILAAVFLFYVHSLLVDFEASQVDNIISAKLDSIKAAASAGKLEKEISLDGIKEQYQPTDEELKSYQNAFAIGELTYKKSRSGLSSDTVTYDIYLNGFNIGNLVMKTLKEDTVLAIFPITEWAMISCEAKTFSFDFPANVTVTSGGEVIEGKPSETEGLLTYTVSSLFHPDTLITDTIGNTVSFNGKEAVSFVYYTVKALTCYDVYYGDKPVSISKAKVTGIDKYQYVKEYCDEIPDLATYELCVIDDGSSISVKDKSGAVVEAVTKDNVITAETLPVSDTLPTGLEGDPDPLDMAERWSLFMSQDLAYYGWPNGFYKLAEYLAKGSYYYDSMYKYATGIDITFTSGHSLGNPAFVNESVTDYVKFSDRCFSCHIKFDKPMYLSTGLNIVDPLDSTFYFIYVDDTDDGVNNPHWAVIDRQ